MKEKNKIAENYLKEVARNLQRDVFEINGSHVAYLGKPLCQLTDTGGITYRPEDVKGKLRESAKRRALDIVRTTSEYMRVMEMAPFLKAEGLSEQYKALADFNGVVLAGKHSAYGVQFVTWDWTFDHRGVTQGHYFSESYQEAKQDFAIRSGLVEQGQLLKEYQLREVGASCKTILEDGYNLSDKQKVCLQEVQNQIEAQIPDEVKRYELGQEYPIQTL